MALTPIDVIHDALREAYDPEYYAGLYRQMRYAFGEGWQEEGLSGAYATSDGDFPDFPAIRVRQLRVGESRRILNAALIDLARNMYSPGEPEFPEVDKYTAEIRKRYFQKRASEGEWDAQRAAAFLEGRGLGNGFLQVGWRTNPKTGRQRTHLRHSPTCFTLWDPHEASAGRAGYVAFVHHFSLHRAIAMYGPNMEQYAEEVDLGRGHKLRTVRVFEYYDLGHGRWEPTMAILPKRMTERPIRRMASPWSERLPFAYYENVLLPGMRRPVGSIPLQMSTQEGLNKLERYFDAIASGPGFDVVDLDQLDPNDVRLAQEGKTNLVRKRAAKPGVAAYDRIPAREASATSLNLYAKREQQFNADSGTNEYDRGGRPEGDLTAFEVNKIAQESARSGSWTEKQTTAFAVRTVERVLEAAALGDTDAVELDLFGATLPLNDPRDPRSALANWLEEPSLVLIADGSLRYQDEQRKRAQRLLELRELQAEVGAGLVNRRWYLEEKLRAVGVMDVEAALAPNESVGPSTSSPVSIGAPESEAPTEPAPSL